MIIIIVITIIIIILIVILIIIIMIIFMIIAYYCYYYYYFTFIIVIIKIIIIVMAYHENRCCFKKKKQASLSAKSLLQVKRTCKDELATIHHGSNVTRIRFLLEHNMVAPIIIMVSCCENLLEDGALVDAQLSTVV